MVGTSWLLSRLRQENRLDLGVWDQPGKHSKTLSQNKQPTNKPKSVSMVPPHCHPSTLGS